MADGEEDSRMTNVSAASGDAGLGDVRPQHRLDEAKLEAYLARHVTGFAGPLVIRQYQGGQSNPTYALTTPTARYVLRKKPPGQLLASAHAVDREYRVQLALQDSAVPVPRLRHYCDDADVIGTPFYVMDHLEGRVFRDPRLPGMAPAERGAIYDTLCDTMAALHRVDVAKAGLAEFGKGGSYFTRQIGRWTKQWEASKPEDLPEMERLMAWLPAHIPPGDDETTIAHGDYRLENLIFHPTGPQALAVLDWELATLGHPLADVAYCCLVWKVTLANQPGFTDGVPDGIPSERDFVARYCAATGRNPIPADHWAFYQAFALFRLAAIAAGVYQRGQQGNASSDTAFRFREVMQVTARAGAGLAGV